MVSITTTARAVGGLRDALLGLVTITATKLALVNKTRPRDCSIPYNISVGLLWILDQGERDRSTLFKMDSASK
jgi:hypothetical protein